MGSFKLRLVAYFVCLSLLPLLAASWAFSEVAARGEVRRADSRLNAALRVAIADYTDEVSAADATAASLAEAPRVQRAFRDRNRAALVRLAQEVPGATFYSGAHRLAGGVPPALGAKRSATVVSEAGRPLGRIVVSLSLDDDLVRRLRTRVGFEAADRLLFVSRGQVVAGPAALRGSLDVPTAGPAYRELGGVEYRAVGTRVLAGRPSALVVALTPKSEIDAAIASLRRRVIVFGLVALALVALLAYTFGRAVVRSLKELADAAGAVARGDFSRRVRAGGRDELASVGRAFNDMAAQLETRLEELAAERGRVRDAVARFGEALAATHNRNALLEVIVESTVEATGAASGRLMVGGEELASAGTSAAGGRALEIPLGSEQDDAVLLLTPATSDFSDEARELAHWLGSQAWVALENARLHRQVERQATTDQLTDLANRRQFEEALGAELARLERFGGGLALVLADLDDFKQVNDSHGHRAGDQVLRAFAEVLRDTVREIDLAARFGGEEFALLLPGTDLEGAGVVAERLRERLAARRVVAPSGAAIGVTSSFGVAVFPDADTEEALFGAADDALYRAKALGKNRVELAGDPVRAAR